MVSENQSNSTYLIIFVVVSVTVVGFFVGLQSPMNPALQSTFQADEESGDGGAEESAVAVEPTILPAIHYSEIAKINQREPGEYQTRLSDLRSTVDPLAEITITNEQKSYALALREQNRAFNGAPPTVPHPIDQLSSQACMSCHSTGMVTPTFRISKMSHQFLANCTQCHVESEPVHRQYVEFGKSEFVGLPAPTGGPRAFDGAPPMIPHSTWMRVDCASCHGSTGAFGIRTTHPWRSSCQQCHAPSSQLDQTLLQADPQFLRPLPAGGD